MANSSWCCCLLGLLFVFASVASAFPIAETHYHEFIIQSTPVKRLCKTHNKITVNGQFPGPTLEVRNGDTLIIKAVNRAQYNITLHWHGVHQIRTAWADGPNYVTQCPIQPGGSYTYRFTIIDQEGTLWWHAHASWLRATVYGALIIKPKLGSFYPFPKPDKEFPVILGQWWHDDPINVINRALRTGAGPNVSDALTINGQPGDFYNCSRQDTVIFPMECGESNLLRIINAAMNELLFFTIANHKMTVVAADANYVKPFTTRVLEIGPGQTTDVIITLDQPPTRYYMAARVYSSFQGNNVPFDNTTTSAIIQYMPKGTTPYPGTQARPTRRRIPLPRPILPILPRFNDTPTVTRYVSNFRSLSSNNQVPIHIDEHLFFTVGLGLNLCIPSPTCQGAINGTRFTASMNNVSYVQPSNFSIIQAYVQNSPNGVYTINFPPVPPVQFDYTGNVSRALWTPIPGTEVYTLKFGATVQLVLQDQAIYAAENHPIHLHGYNFYIIGAGFGNFNPNTDPARFNLVDPPLRNTVGVPVGGWAVIRFTATNPGVWLMHCHFDTHLSWGLAMVFIVENGVGELETLEPPPSDLPQC